jgi:exosortase
MSAPSSSASPPHALPVPPIVVVAVALVAASIWAVWPRLVEMSQVWAENPTYSHGFLVPLFSLGLLWWNRRPLAAVRFRPSWWGVAIIALAGLVQFAGLYFFIPWLEGASLLVFLAGVAMLLGGRPLLAATWKAIAFLVFMIPLPWTIEATLRVPLRLFAAQVSNWLLQLFGLASVVEGTVIDIGEHKLGVEEACSGIAMLMTFVALAVGLAIVVRRPWVDKLVIILSAVPIAILCNVLRITATGVLYATVGENVGKFIYHDLAGFLMMPLGIAFLWLELFVLDHLLVAPQARADRPVSPLVIPGLSQPPVRGVGRT